MQPIGFAGSSSLVFFLAFNLLIFVSLTELSKIDFRVTNDLYFLFFPCSKLFFLYFRDMKYDFINSARGIAILMVILVHTSQLLSVPFNNQFIKFICEASQLGVQFFFVASAYTLCLSQENRSDEKNKNLNFFIRRFFRIFPIYYLGIISYYFLNLYFKNADAYTVKNILSNVFFIHGVVPSANNSIVPGGWSIGTEMLFYLIFPALFKFLQTNILLKSFYIILTCFTFTFFLKEILFDQSFVYFNILNQLPVFIIGILYWKYNKDLHLKLALPIFLISLFATFVLWEGDKTLIPFFSAILFCSLIKILENTKINNAFFQKIGVQSYSMYISHFVLCFYLLPLVSNLRYIVLYFFLVTAFSYVIALFLNKFIEKPFIKLGFKLISKLNLNK